MVKENGACSVRQATVRFSTKERFINWLKVNLVSIEIQVASQINDPSICPEISKDVFNSVFVKIAFTESMTIHCSLLEL